MQSHWKSKITGRILDVLKQQKTRTKHDAERRYIRYTGTADA